MPRITLFSLLPCTFSGWRRSDCLSRRWLSDSNDTEILEGMANDVDSEAMGTTVTVKTEITKCRDAGCLLLEGCSNL
ncbi:uncharacterized protein BJX67DRAFT_362059 [Aspergillus lucknowensis]|uniref:Secreted protein n=1 Tax=Aspergillus lucknowensis TaxID=176173 RepID=A0ABR4LHR3_9EURO